MFIPQGRTGFFNDAPKRMTRIVRKSPVTPKTRTELETYVDTIISQPDPTFDQAFEDITQKQTSVDPKFHEMAKEIIEGQEDRRKFFDDKRTESKVSKGIRVNHIKDDPYAVTNDHE